MTEYLYYNLHVAVLIAVFYMFYRLLIAKESFHRLNRIVLIGTAVTSFVLPLCVLTFHQTVEVSVSNAPEPHEPVLMMPDETVKGTAFPMTAPTTSEPFDWSLVVQTIYVAGVLFVLARMCLSLWRMNRLIKSCQLIPLEEADIPYLDALLVLEKAYLAVSDRPLSPFSWRRYIVMSRKDYEEADPVVLAHELGHIMEKHSRDILLIEVLTAMQWFNPAMWMLRADLRTIHEYEADQAVLNRGFNAVEYLHLLIKKAAGYRGYSLANGIINSNLKKRVEMIMKPKSSRWRWLRLAYIIPIIAVSLYATAETQINYIPAQQGEEDIWNRKPVTQKPQDVAILIDKNGHWRTSVPVGAVYSWVVNGRLVEHALVTEDSFWQYHSGETGETVVSLDGEEISMNNIPYVPVETIKEVRYIQGESPRRIELFTTTKSLLYGQDGSTLPATFKDKVHGWATFVVTDMATGRMLEGATVTIVETGVVAKTNAEGWCEMEISKDATVSVAYDGMETQTRQIKNVHPLAGGYFRMNKVGEPIYSQRDSYYGGLQEEAQFPGDMNRWIQQHSRYAGKERHISVEFVVNEDGSVSGARIHQGVSAELNAEALRLVNAMPRWRPAIKEGRPVKCLCYADTHIGTR